MGFLRWIIALPILVGCFIFAVSNPDTVSIHLPTISPIELPLYIVAFVALGVGFLFGAAILWLSMGKLRKERKQYKKTVKKLEKEISEINDKLHESLSSSTEKENVIDHD